MSKHKDPWWQRTYMGFDLVEWAVIACIVVVTGCVLASGDGSGCQCQVRITSKPVAEEPDHD